MTTAIVEQSQANSVVKKSNLLIEARHAKVLDVRAMRLVAQAAARITVKDKDFATYRIPVKSITTSPDIYNRTEDDSFVIDRITDQLLANIIRMPQKDADGKNSGKSFTKYSYFSKCEYIAGTGFVELQFHPDLKEYFLQLKNNFTQLSLEILCSIPSTYSYRLYELLKQYSQGGIHKRVFVITDLMDMIGIKPGPDSSYRKYSKFRQKVLLPAQKNFKRHTDLLFEFRAWADHGRQYTHIEFIMKKNSGYTSTLFDISKEINDKVIDTEMPLTLSEDIRKLIPQGQWKNGLNGCHQVINEIINKEGVAAAEFYIKYVKDLDDKKKRDSWGKAVRSVWKQRLYNQHLKDVVDQKEKRIFEEQQAIEDQKKLDQEMQARESEKEQAKSDDRIINSILNSDRKEQFEKFIEEHVREHENKVTLERFNRGKGAIRQVMYRKYFELYLNSLLGTNK